MQLLPSGYGALIRSSENVFAYLWEIFIFKTTPGYIKIIGAILTSISVITIIKHNLQRNLNKIEDISQVEVVELASVNSKSDDETHVIR